MARPLGTATTLETLRAIAQTQVDSSPEEDFSLADIELLANLCKNSKPNLSVVEQKRNKAQADKRRKAVAAAAAAVPSLGLEARARRRRRRRRRRGRRIGRRGHHFPVARYGSPPHGGVIPSRAKAARASSRLAGTRTRRPKSSSSPRPFLWKTRFITRVGEFSECSLSPSCSVSLSLFLSLSLYQQETYKFPRHCAPLCLCLFLTKYILCVRVRARRSLSLSLSLFLSISLSLSPSLSLARVGKEDREPAVSRLEAQSYALHRPITNLAIMRGVCSHKTCGFGFIVTRNGKRSPGGSGRSRLLREAGV